MRSPSVACDHSILFPIASNTIISPMLNKSNANNHHHGLNTDESNSFFLVNNKHSNNKLPNNQKNKNESLIQKQIVGGTSTSSQSRVPDILMINKYYGLVPQKFAISSRKPTASISSTSAPNSRRLSKPGSARPHGKSPNFHQRHQQHEVKTGLGRDAKGHKSDNDSPELINRKLGSRNSSIEFESLDEKCADPFGLVTKRMSVEKNNKKWRDRANRGINLNLSSSIGQTLSLLQKSLLPDNFQCLARKNESGTVVTSSTDFHQRNRRVIKIDLNRVSQDEESYEIQTSPERCTQTVKQTKNATGYGNNENGTGKRKVTSISLKFSEENNSKTALSSLQESSQTVCSLSDGIGNNGCIVSSTNSDKECLLTDESGSIPLKNANNIKKMKEVSRITEDSLVINKVEQQKELSPTNESMNHHVSVEMDNEVKCAVTVDSNKNNISRPTNDQKEMKERRKLISQRAISFDEKLLPSGIENLEKSAEKHRPSTAVTSRNSNNRTFNTPNNFNPPSKVIPWTQQKTAGGKPLTLAERRAKFQRAPSIHSSSSLSMEIGEDEILSEEVDSNNISGASNSSYTTPSSAFRESRKPLYVMQPPEVPTMISQINPNADENIQIEIEKVALMLRKMQTLHHFSKSLDSGIEAVSKASSAREENSLSTLSSTSSDKRLVSSSSSAAAVSVSSTEKSLEYENNINEDNKSSNNSALANKERRNSLGAELHVEREATSAKDGPIITRLCGTTTKVNMNMKTAPNNSKSSVKRTLSSPSLQNINPSSSSSRTAAQRPPLKKAVSISCEQELLKSGGSHRQNEVNSNAGDDRGKNVRPKTATVGSATNSQRNYGTGTRSPRINYSHHPQNGVSSGESHCAFSSGSITGSNSSGIGGSQGSRNRKILIKKALMEVNQSSTNLRRKWGTLGRPRTAPNVVHQVGTMSQQQHPNSYHQQRRKPLKASPFPISGNGRMGMSSSGKSSSPGGGKSSEMEGEGSNEDKGNRGSHVRANSENVEETGDKSEQQEGDESSSLTNMRGRSMFRQSFSLDENALLGFSMRSMQEGRMPIFEKLGESTGISESGSTSSILNDDLSFLTPMKREQCLKVYQKMMKTGCNIKLDTVFRGMLTPSEYRAFMKAAEQAAYDEAEEKTEEVDANEENQALDNVKTNDEQDK